MHAAVAALVVLFAAVAQASSLVPVVAWTAANPTLLGAQPSLRIGQTLSAAEAAAKVVSPAKAAVVVFELDHLSIEELATSTSLQSLESLVTKSAASVVLPLVDGSLVNALVAAAKEENVAVLHTTLQAFRTVDSAKGNSAALVVIEVKRSESNIVDAMQAALAHAATLYTGMPVVGVITAQAASPSAFPAEAVVSVERRDLAGAAASMLRDPGRDRRLQGNDYMYFTIPIFMGIVTGLFIIVVVMFGITGIMYTQTTDQFASSNDKPLQVPQ
eukprot:m.60618 g.60618  ORF g.60618 m.60618 type:complete len:273 (-) comp13673_c0_seq1:281-1099(-)